MIRPLLRVIQSDSGRYSEMMKLQLYTGGTDPFHQVGLYGPVSSWASRDARRRYHPLAPGRSIARIAPYHGTANPRSSSRRPPAGERPLPAHELTGIHQSLSYRASEHPTPPIGAAISLRASLHTPASRSNPAGRTASTGRSTVRGSCRMPEPARA